MGDRFSREPLDGSEPSLPGTPVPTGAGANRGTRGHRWWRRAFVALAVALLTWALVDQRAAVGKALTTLDPWTLVLAVLAVLAGLGCNMMSWRGAMAAVGADLPLRPAARVFFLSQLGKYVPGSVWPVLAQVELTRDSGVSRLRGAVGAVVAMVVGVITSGTVAVALLVIPDPAVRQQYWWLLLVVPVAAVAVHPTVLAATLRFALRVSRRTGAVPELGGRALVRSVAWSAAMWGLFGLHAWLIVRDLAAPAGPGMFTVTGAFALAWVVGFVVVIAPAGLGPREAALTLALAGHVTTGQALALAVLSRLVMTVADAAAAGAAVLAARRRGTDR